MIIKVALPYLETASLQKKRINEEFHLNRIKQN